MNAVPRDIIEIIFDFVESPDQYMIIPAFYVCKRWYRIIRYRFYQLRKTHWIFHVDPTFHAPIHRTFWGTCIIYPDYPLRTWALSSSSIILGREFRMLINGGSLDSIKTSLRTLRTLQPQYIGSYVLGTLCIMAAARGNLATYRYAKAVSGSALNGYTCQCIVAYGQYLVQSNAPSKMVRRFLLQQEGRHLLQRHDKWLAKTKLSQMAGLHVRYDLVIEERICDHQKCHRHRIRVSQAEQEWIKNRRHGNPDRPHGHGIDIPYCSHYKVCPNAEWLRRYSGL